MTEKPLRVLIVEDNPTDAELVVRELKRAGFALEWRRVETEASYLARLDDKIDIVLSDYSLPQFDGLRALQLLKQRKLDIPFIIISGTIGEETAVAAMRDGADDYLLKDRLTRLGGAVEHALQQKRQRDERRRAEAELRTLTAEHELILNSAGEGIHGIDLEGKIIFENPKAGELLGWKPNELIGRPAHLTIHHTHADRSPYPIEQCPIYASMHDGGTRRITNDVFWRKDGSSFRVDYVAAPVRDADGTITGSIVTFKDITEQFAAEQRLKLQEQQYRLLFETNPNAMWVFDAKTLQVLAVNDAATAQYGYTRDEFLTLKVSDLRLPEERDELWKKLRESNASQRFSGERQHLRKDGAVIDVVIYSSPLIWNGLGARMVTGVDVTERRKVQAELHATHQRLRELLAHTPAVIYSLAIEGETVRPLFVSENIERLLGFTAAESASFDWWLRNLHPDDCERALATLKKSFAHDGYSMEYRIRHKDGSYHWVHDNNRLIRGANGEPKEMVGVWNDVTERKKTEERLREQSEIIDRAQDAIMIRNYHDLRITFWNKGAEQLYGWTAAEVLQRSDVTTLSDPQQAEAIMSILRTASEFRGELKQKTKDGRHLVAASRVTVVPNDDGTPRSILIICTDVTEQKKLETQLLRAQRLESIGTLASGVAHDLNNIITPILMCAESLRETFDPKDAQDALDLIIASARRGAAVVKQVLTFARGIEGERVTINPRHLIEEMADIAQNTFPKSIEVVARYPEDLWSIEGDPTQLHQVLLNLSVNARDAMPEGGSLTIAAENVDLDESYAATMPDAKPGPHVVLWVSDTGTGMPRSTVEKIFDPFFTTKQLGKGTGLGLSTSLGIVKSHGGFLSVYSEPGRGTTFRIFLPAIDVQAKSARTSAAKLMKGNNELILLVDDEETIRRVTRATLEKNNYRVLEAGDGPEALGVFAQQMGAIKAVITDIMMPYMDGVALIRAMKKMQPEMKFIASTGQGEEARTSELQNLKVSNVLSKPYDTEKLLRTIHETLATRS